MSTLCVTLMIAGDYISNDISFVLNAFFEWLLLVNSSKCKQCINSAGNQHEFEWVESTPNVC